MSFLEGGVFLVVFAFAVAWIIHARLGEHEDFGDLTLQEFFRLRAHSWFGTMILILAVWMIARSQL